MKNSKKTSKNKLNGEFQMKQSFPMSNYLNTFDQKRKT